MSKVKASNFHAAMRSIAYELGFDYDCEDFEFDKSEQPYSYTLLGRLQDLTKQQNGQHKYITEKMVLGMESLQKQISSLQSDLKMVMNHLGIEVVTLHGKEVRKVKKPITGSTGSAPKRVSRVGKAVTPLKAPEEE